MNVLQPVNRHRRRRARIWPRVLATAIATMATAVAVMAFADQAGRRGGPPAEPRPVAGPSLRVPLHPATARRRRPRSLLHLAKAHLAAPQRPLAARSAILVDDRDGGVLYARYPHRKLPIASTTKIMTALLVLRHDRLEQTVRIAPSVPTVPLVKEGLRAGERVRVWKLLYGLLLYSGNDDAAALALATGGTRRGFLRLMNDEAHRLGLHDTHFNTPSGVLDERNYSSAWDLAALTRVALRNAEFRHIVRTRIERVRWAPPTYSKVYVNRNLLLWSYRGAIGVKTGFTTAAGQCLVAAATRAGRTLIAVLLHDPTPYADATRLFNRGWRAAG